MQQKDPSDEITFVPINSFKFFYTTFIDSCATLMYKYDYDIKFFIFFFNTENKSGLDFF